MAFLEGTTVRYVIENVVHDVDGPLTSTVNIPTSATWVAYRVDGTPFASGVLTYQLPFGWTATLDVPAIADGLIESITVVGTIVYAGATQKFPAVLDDADVPVVGL